MARAESSSKGPKRTPRADAPAVAPPAPHPALAARAPMALASILGQDRAIAVINATLLSGRVHHAWVFAGPMGVGKRTAAEAFGAVLLDPTSRRRASGIVEPDAGSEIQRLLASGTHPDLHIITKELAAFSDDPRVRAAKQTTIAKDVLDAHLLGPIARAPSIKSESLASKVFIVDEAELLDRSRSNATSQNALLKTLEEPPPGSVIILVTAQEDRLLPTIRSRCQRIGFTSLDDDAMNQWIESSGRAVPKGDRPALLAFAAGSPGRAALALDTGLLDWAHALEGLLKDAAKGRYRPDLALTMSELVESWAVANVERAEKLGAQASKEAAVQEATRHLVALLSDWARRRLRATTEDPDRALRDIEAIARAERAMHANVQGVFAWEDLAATLCAP